MLTPEMRRNPELQSALVRLGIWVFAVSYVGLGAVTGYYQVESGYYFSLFGGFLILSLGILASILLRPLWRERQLLGILLDVTAVTLAIFLTRDISPFYLFYIWIFISAGARYGSGHLFFASLSSLIAYNLVLIALDEWSRHTQEAIFFLLLLMILPLYLHSLLRRLQEARRDAELANKAKGNFLTVMTHELRTPLTGVIGMADLLKMTRLSPEQREYLSAIASSADLLRDLIGDVLDLSKIEARKLHLESIPFDLARTLLEVCAALESQALGKGVELILRVDPAIPPEVTGDPLRVRQILFNLLGNAIKFTEQGEIRVRAAARPPEDQMPRQHLLLEVEDTGIGIPKEKLGEIFETWTQGNESTSRRYGGTGLGTTIARDLTRLMGGRIGVESREGEGTRFWVRLPLLSHGVRPAALPARNRLAGLRAFIYDKGESSRELITEICGAEGMVCHPLVDPGRLGRRSAQEREVDLLIVADSPERQDLAALADRCHRVLGPGLPHLFLTYGARRVDEAMECEHCLNKPFLPEDLIERIRRLVGRSVPAPTELPAPTRGEIAPVTAKPAAPIAILVAEDNEIAAKVISALLARQGVDVTLVSDGRQALERAGAQPFAMAFVDLNMPGLDGIGFARAHRETEASGSHLPIVALTATAAEEVKGQCLEAGMDGFLSKPIKPQELAEMVSRYANPGS